MAILRAIACRLCIAAACVPLVSCDLIREPLAVTLTDDRPFVGSVLLAGDSTARVLLSIVPAMGDRFNPFAEPFWIPIGDARVRLIAGSDTIPLVTQAGAATNPCIAGPVHETSPAGALLPGCYVGAVRGGIQSGATYRLIADVPGHGRIEGETTVPAAPSIRQPAAGADFAASAADAAPPPRVTVEWSSVEAGIVELNVSSLDERCTIFITTGVFGYTIQPVIRDGTSAEIMVRMHCSAAVEDGVPGYISLTAFDSTYARYRYATGRNHPLSEASAGFTGPAIGHFGSAAPLRHPVQFVPH